MGHGRDWFDEGNEMQKEPEEAYTSSTSYGQFLLPTYHSSSQQIPVHQLLLVNLQTLVSLESV